MAAAAQPVDEPYPDRDSWQTLVGDQRYRLFAAGNRRAAIAESLAAQSSTVNLAMLAPAASSFDARYGLGSGAQRGLVLLTEVCRVPEEAHRNEASRNAARGGQQWRWEATHYVQPISQLKTYIDEQSGSCVFFLTRSKQPVGAPAAKTREGLVDSAVRIGRSLGLDAKNLEALRVAGMVHEMGKLSPPRSAGEKFYVSSDEEKNAGEICRIADCGNTPTAHLLSEPFCTEHFITTCYERLDMCADRLTHRPATDAESNELQAFLNACIEQTTALTRNPFHQEALERARLLDILYTATELCRHMRRSARLAEAIPVRLLCETPGRYWEEILNTKLISQHGAMLECAHLVRPEDWLFVERMDTGSRTRARMAWRSSAAGGHFAVALEFVDADNFWQLSWEGRPGISKSNGARAGV